MSEPAAKQRQMIDLDEFERRLSRSPAPVRGGDDPLAELARLVGGGEDRFGDLFQGRPGRARAPEPRAPQPPEPHVPDWLVEEAHTHSHQPYSNQPHARQPQAHQARTHQPAPLPPIDFAAIEAGLRGSLPPEYQNFADTDEYADEQGEDWFDTPLATEAPHIIEAPRSRLPLYATAAIIVAGIAGIGATFAIKRTPPAPQEIALIKASTAPVKVAAVGATDTDQSQDASILDKTPQPAPTGVVSHTEQPVDVSSVVPKPASDAGASNSATAETAPPAAQVAATAPAAAVPVPPPPGADSGAGAGLTDMMEPRKVKTIAVRPDGSLMNSSAAPGAAQSLPVGTISPPGAPSMDASATGTATSAPPPAEAPPRMAGKAEDLPWSNQQTSDAPQSSPPQSSPPPAAEPRHSHKPERIARADIGADETEAVDAGGGAGGFSVQLAAPASEAEARTTLNRLTRTYGAELRGYHLKFHMAKVANKTVYRVRVGGLSHASAISLCEKLKAKGGSCFVAHG
jgi:hypothetical protein